MKINSNLVDIQNSKKLYKSIEQFQNKSVKDNKLNEKPDSTARNKNNSIEFSTVQFLTQNEHETLQILFNEYNNDKYYSYGNKSSKNFKAGLLLDVKG